MSRLFLSYRRADSPDTVKLIFERLRDRLPRWDIFYDHESLEGGEAFPERLRTEISGAAVVFAVIGPRWLDQLRSRRAQRVDHVREELRVALESGGRVVPLLVQNAAPPSEEDLADFPELRPIASLNCKQVRPHPDFDYDLDRLVAFLEPLGPSVDVGTVLSGKYKLTRFVAEGGMGVVYQAEQLSPRRTVAVKLIKPGMDTREVLARFDAERQALAVMDHPNIAKVIDAGVTPHGRPFFVMSFVAGEPITEYCDRRRLTLAQRLELFCQVCGAVQHAHQKGIIHRDLKPSNILVEHLDGRAVSKVIDFGLAKALNYRLTDQTLVSEQGRTVGTLLYSSPEQAAGRVSEVDTRSDIYSLGVVLYEMLAGAPPFTEEQLRAAGDDAMKRLICDQPPPVPSTRLSSSAALPSIAACRNLEPLRLTRLVRGELDWIVMKSLEKEVGGRYPTAASFAEDVQRFLKDEPVSAGKPSALTRFRKYVRRHRGVAAAVAVVLATLILGAAGTTAGMFQVRRARADESRQRELAQRRAEELRGALEEVGQQRELAEESLAHNRLLLAEASFGGSGTGDQSLTLLESIPERFRGWEHGYLKRKYHGGFASLDGFSENLRDLRFSPDGGGVAAAGNDGAIRYWDLFSGELLLERESANSMSSVRFTPDGSRLVAASDGEDGDVRVWDADDGRVIQTIAGGLGVESIDLSPDGLRIVAGTRGGNVGVWDIGSGEQLLEIDVRPLPREDRCVVDGVCFSPDGQKILAVSSGSGDILSFLGGMNLKLWDARSGELLLGPLEGAGGWGELAFSPTGDRFAGGDGTGVRVWDAATGRVLLSLESDSYADAIRFSPDGSQLAACDGSSVRIWDAVDGRLLRVLKGYSFQPFSIDFSPSGAQLAAGSNAGEIRVWDLSDSRGLRVMRGHSGGVAALRFSGDGSHLVSSGADGEVRVWDAITGSLVTTIDCDPEDAATVALDHNAARLCVGVPGEGQLQLRVSDARLLAGDWDSQSIASAVVYTADGSRAAVGGTFKHPGKTAWVVDSRTSQKLFTANGDPQPITAVALSFDGTLMADGSNYAPPRVWDVDRGVRKFTLEGHKLAVTCLTFSPRGDELASGSYDRTVRIWDMATGLLRTELSGHTEGVTCIAFSPDGSRVVSGSEDGALRVWDSRSGRSLVVLEGHTAAVRGVAFSPDGLLIASGGDDRTVRLWDARPLPEAASPLPDDEWSHRFTIVASITGWHWSQAARAASAGNEFAFRFHLAKLNEIEPLSLEDAVEQAIDFAWWNRSVLAGPLLERVIERYSAEADDVELADQLERIVQILTELGQFASAEPFARQCVAVRQRVQPDDWKRYYAACMLGRVLLDLERVTEAQKLMQAGQEGLRRTESASPPDSSAMAEVEGWIEELEAAVAAPKENIDGLVPDDPMSDEDAQNFLDLFNFQDIGL